MTDTEILRIATNAAKKYCRHVPREVRNIMLEFDDCVQVAAVGILRARTDQPRLAFVAGYRDILVEARRYQAKKRIIPNPVSYEALANLENYRKSYLKLD